MALIWLYSSRMPNIHPLYEYLGQQLFNYLRIKNKESKYETSSIRLSIQYKYQTSIKHQVLNQILNMSTHISNKR